jgi:hypothetical protein
MPLANQWNLGIAQSNKNISKHGIEADLTVDLEICVICKKTDEDLSPSSEPLKSCPCLFARYCGTECQKKHWKDHRGLHDIRMIGKQKKVKKSVEDRVLSKDEIEEIIQEVVNREGLDNIDWFQ